MTNHVNRERRVEALEAKANPPKPCRAALICCHPCESEEEATARHIAEHGPLPDVEEGQLRAVYLVDIAPKERAA